jgi:hypothetical protein
MRVYFTGMSLPELVRAADALIWTITREQLADFLIRLSRRIRLRWGDVLVHSHSLSEPGQTKQLTRVGIRDD